MRLREDELWSGAVWGERIYIQMLGFMEVCYLKDHPVICTDCLKDKRKTPKTGESNQIKQQRLGWQWGKHNPITEKKGHLSSKLREHVMNALKSSVRFGEISVGRNCWCRTTLDMVVLTTLIRSRGLGNFSERLLDPLLPQRVVGGGCDASWGCFCCSVAEWKPWTLVGILPWESVCGQWRKPRREDPFLGRQRWTKCLSSFMEMTLKTLPRTICLHSLKKWRCISAPTALKIKTALA